MKKILIIISFSVLLSCGDHTELFNVKTENGIIGTAFTLKSQPIRGIDSLVGKKFFVSKTQASEYIEIVNTPTKNKVTLLGKQMGYKTMSISYHGGCIQIIVPDCIKYGDTIRVIHGMSSGKLYYNKNPFHGEILILKKPD